MRQTIARHRGVGADPRADGDPQTSASAAEQNLVDKPTERLGVSLLMEGLIHMQAAQTSEARRANFDELRRTLQYLEASRASQRSIWIFFSSLLALQKRHA